MQPALVDVSVLLIFFTRVDTFSQVFAQVKKARPARLFLYQDGPRQNRQDDIVNIEACRKIALDIDWECEVHTKFQIENFGCDPSGYIAHTWAFSQTDKCIVIEDDDVPSVSFFKFCKEILDKYENDERVRLIVGSNFDEQTKYCPYDYFFSSTSFTLGCWASWSRVVSKWDKTYKFLNDDYYVRVLSDKIQHCKFTSSFIPTCIFHRNSPKDYFESIMISQHYLQSGLTIIPQKNMIINIGLTGEATHTSTALECLPKGYRKIFQLKTFEIEKDIVHPPYIIEDFSYKDRAYRIEGWGHPWIKIYRLVESSIYRMIHGDFKGIFKDIKDKFGKFFSHRAY